MFIKWNREFLPRFTFQVGPDGSSGGDSSPSGGGGSSSSSASSSTPSAAPSSGSTPSSPSPSATPSSPSSASPSPSATPASPATPSPGGAPPSGGDALDFESIFAGPQEPAPTPVTPPAPTPTPTPATPPAATAPAVAEPAKVEAAAPAATPAPTTPTSTEPSAPVLDPSDPASIAAHLMSNKDAAIAHIAEKMFKLSPEDVEALESDTVGTIPKLLARSFVEVQSVMLNQMARLVPQMIHRQTEAIKKNAEAEDAFYSMWPTIDKGKHGTLVKNYAITFRNMHPQATREQMFASVGPLVMMAAQIPLTAPAAARSAAAPGAPSPKPMPFVPAGGSAPGGTNNHTVELNPVEAMFAGQDQ